MSQHLLRRSRKAPLPGLLSCIGGACAALLLSFSAHAGNPPVVTSLREIRHHHVVIQQWDLSCGAATLATILKYQYGKPVTERQVAIGLMKRARYVKHPKLVQLRQGFSLLDLKRYADSKGYKGIGLGKLTLGGLVKRVPVIVPVRLHGYNHFVVFRGISGDRVLLADPAWGNRTMLVDRFKDAWIDYPKFGHVGFVVAKASGKLAPPNGLAPRPREFRFRR